MIVSLLLALLLDDPGCASTPERTNFPPSRFLVPGKLEPNWCNEGVDLFALLGPDADPPMELVDEAGLTRFSRTALDPPKEWGKVRWTPGRDEWRGDFHEILVQNDMSRLIGITVHPAWRVGKAICVRESGPTTLYWAGPADEIDVRVAPKTDAIGSWDPVVPVLCMTLHAVSGGYRIRYHDPQGHALDDVNAMIADQVATISPAGDPTRVLALKAR
jgi:hypothetical protein